jgi:hypothetical protein
LKILKIRFGEQADQMATLVYASVNGAFANHANHRASCLLLDVGVSAMAKRTEFQDRNTLTGESNLILPESIYDSHRHSVAVKISVFITFGLWHIHCP